MRRVSRRRVDPSVVLMVQAGALTAFDSTRVWLALLGYFGWIRSVWGGPMPRPREVPDRIVIT